MKISIIVAKGTNQAIGKNNKLLWHLPIDLRFFKSKTVGHCIVMGRNTYESIGRALPNRTNIVVSNSLAIQTEGIIVQPSLEAALNYAKAQNETECFVIGGGQIYQEAIAIAHCIYLTQVNEAFEADIFFPDIDFDLWEEQSIQHYPPDVDHRYPFSIATWVRKDVS